MRKLLLPGLVMAALAAAAPGVRAASDSRHLGGCSFATQGDPTSTQHVGEMDVEAVVYSPGGANPVWATATCYLTVNGVPQPGTLVTATGAVVVAGGGLITFEAGPDDIVDMCERVDFTGPGDTTPTVESCGLGYPWYPPYHLVWDAVDPLVCGTLAGFAGTYGPVHIEEQGDVYVNGEWFYDCPPFRDWSAR